MAERGFDQPVLDAQRLFRALLTVLSEPGRVVAVAPCCSPPGGLDPAAIAVVLALCDGDTPLWLDPVVELAADFIRFHTGAPIVAAPGDASFLLAHPGHRPPLAALRAGTPEYPDRSAMLILAVPELREGEGWQLAGPGIPDHRRLHAGGIDPGFAAEWRENHARFPRGVDVVLAACDRLAGLSRSTSLGG